jgi:hypothetical protein
MRHVQRQERPVQHAPSRVRDYAGDIELFIVHCPETDGIYAIPIDEATRTQGTLRIDPTGNGQDKRVRWARDYELPA